MQPNKTLVIGSRSSKLALVQAELIKKELKGLFSGVAIEIKTIKTTGDKILDTPLNKIGGKGLFTKEIEQALLKGEIDIAVHSMKDLPTDTPLGLIIAAITKREDPSDILVSKSGFTLKALPKNSKVGTSSLRRKSQLLNIRDDLEVLDLRGNLDTRIQKLESGLYDAVIVAYAGVKRLGLSVNMSQILIEDVLPAAGQGSLGIEIRQGDSGVCDLVKALDDSDSRLAIEAERALLSGLEGGCQIPIGVYAKVEANNIKVRAGVFSLDGKKALRDEIAGPSKNAADLGKELANKLLAKGADKILNEIV